MNIIEADIQKWRSDLPAELLDYLETIESVPSFRKIFHPVVPNNFVAMLISRRHDCSRYLRRVAELTAPLNNADQALLGYFESFVARYGGGHERLQEPLHGWRGSIRSGKNLLAVSHIESLTRELVKGGWVGSISVHLLNEIPDVLNRLIDVPEDLLSVRRINCFIPHVLLFQVLGHIVEAIDAEAAYDGIIDRIEVGGPPEFGQKNYAYTYPTLIVYLDSAAAEGRELLVAKLLQLIEALGGGLAPERIDASLAYQWCKFATGTEGFRLYKRYLRALGMLDGVYEVKWNYAFLKEDGRKRSGVGEKSYLLRDLLVARERPQSGYKR